jgi:hypothetical protein
MLNTSLLKRLFLILNFILCSTIYNSFDSLNFKSIKNSNHEIKKFNDLARPVHALIKWQKLKTKNTETSSDQDLFTTHTLEQNFTLKTKSTNTKLNNLNHALKLESIWPRGPPHT